VRSVGVCVCVCVCVSECVGEGLNSRLLANTEYLCKTTKNTFGIEFTAFKLRDLDRSVTLLEVSKPPDM
jgi:hypothetical protein